MAKKNSKQLERDIQAATCLYARCPPGRDGADDSLCDGDNHLMECPVERARQDILAAHNKVEQLHAE